MFTQHLRTSYEMSIVKERSTYAEVHVQPEHMSVYAVAVVKPDRTAGALNPKHR